MKEELEIALGKIGWTIKGRYPNQYIYDHEGKNAGYRVMGDLIEPASQGKSNLVFEFAGIEVYELDTDGRIDCVGIKAKGNDNVFLQFYNHDNPTPKETT